MIHPLTGVRSGNRLTQAMREALAIASQLDLGLLRLRLVPRCGPAQERQVLDRSSLDRLAPADADG